MESYNRNWASGKKILVEVTDLYAKNIYDEENIPDTIQVFDDYVENLDDNITDNLQVVQSSNQVKETDKFLTPIQPLDTSLNINETLNESNNGKNILIPIPISEETQELDNTIEGRNNYTPIDPVLIDITNHNITNTDTPHEILRKAACKNLQIYTDKMVNQMNKEKKRVKEYQIGDLVRVAIPKIDRFSVNHPILPYKIMERTENNKYRLGSKFGIIKIYYSSGKLEPLETAAFPKLNEIPSNNISIRKAAHFQNVGSISVAVNVIVDVRAKINNAAYRCNSYADTIFKSSYKHTQ
ncbi:hypothetical protein C1645_827325 [Glomus cerebriforme]|uniref:Uncharacterized protein n=1 Tax=Glomus cerebriforme TaxID=658196 RepID=A0A397SXV6_9GLOM|nr:hypothetical protein C1645_827325 [Glomus cerebriforme]